MVCYGISGVLNRVALDSIFAFSRIKQHLSELVTGAMFISLSRSWTTFVTQFRENLPLSHDWFSLTLDYGESLSSLPADVLWGLFVTHSFIPQGTSVGRLFAFVITSTQVKELKLIHKNT